MVCGVTLHRSWGGLCKSDVVLRDVVGRLVLDDLNTSTHIAFAVEKEGEGAGQVFAAERRMKNNVIKREEH